MVPARELAELIIATEDAISSIALQRNPGLNPDEIVVGLVQVESKSLGLSFASSSPDVVGSAFREIADSITRRSFTGLPAKSLRGLRVLADFNNTHNCRAQFWNGETTTRQPLAEMDVGFESFLPEEHFIRGETVIYGKIERVGGVDPKVRVRLSEHEVVSCRLDEALAIELGAHLYTEVGLRGQATWDATDHSLAYFRVDEILQFENRGAAEAALTLKDAAQGAYDAVKDVPGYVRRLREGDEK
ncbi:MAG: hypothetical protein KGJ60_10505 [Verrucomicrobiota bacterium]|nr:hypothetical protein [Verrucomicrobiota bacterium]